MAKRIINKQTILGKALMNEFPWTSEAIAEELGMPLNSFRVWKNKIEKEDKIAKPKVPSLLAQQDPNYKNRILYSDTYLNKLKEIRDSSPKRGKNKTTSSMKHALLKVIVPVFDKNIADFLVKKFKDEQGIENHIRDHIKELAAPALNKIEEIRQRYEKELQEAMNSTP